MNEFFGENNPTRRRVVTAHGIMKRPRREFKVPNGWSVIWKTVMLLRRYRGLGTN